MKNKLLLVCPLLISLAACSGGGSSNGSSGSNVDVPSTSPVAAVGLSYTDPTSTNWRLIKDSSSTQTRIVLNLVGPDNLTARGVGFNLSAGQCANFGTFPTGAYALDTQVFQLKGSNPNFESFAGTDADPVLFVSAPLKTGKVLSTGIFQKDRTYVPKNVNQPLVQIALDLPTGTGTGNGNCTAGSVVALSVVKAKIIPADIGGLNFTLTTDVINKAKMVDISVDVGSLTTM